MKTIPDNKYHLRDLYQEISLYDRKINHFRNFEAFESDAERAAAIAKLESKREALVKTAQGMTERGVEYSDSDVPRSLQAAMLTSKEAQ